MFQPARGMGSSSAFTVGLLHALYVRAGKNPSAHELATAACEMNGQGGRADWHKQINLRPHMAAEFYSISCRRKSGCSSCEMFG